MNALLLGFRGAFFLAAMLLLGEFAFRLCVERAAGAGLRDALAQCAYARRPRALIFKAALAAAVVAAIGWFGLQLAVMSAAAIDAATVKEALFDTIFGRISLLRLALAAALAVLLWRGSGSSGAKALLALGLLLSAAATGHAMAEHGMDRLVHLFADSLHLVSAGAWVGALPALGLVLLASRRDESASALELGSLVVRRFSLLGIASVSALLVSGMINAWYTVGSVPALFGTQYGKLLLAKLLLVAVMVALASTNRFRYTPQLEGGGDRNRKSAALQQIGVNATAEFILGVAVIAVVAALGVVVPGAHTQVVWPLAYTLDWEQAASHATLITLLMAATALSLVIAASLSRRSTAALYVGVPLASAAILAWLAAVPAHRTTYFHSPVRYSVQSIARGKELFSEHCAACHGPEGYGDGPLAAMLAPRPANLVEHMPHHREGDVWWWIAHGIPDTTMLGFEKLITERGIWDIVNLLRARADAHAARSMPDKVTSVAVAAPDFAFEVDRQGEESLSDERDRHSVLVVFFSSGGLDRLRALSRSRVELQRAGLRVIAMPLSNNITPSDPSGNPAIIANFDAGVVAAYQLFAPRPSSGNEPLPEHVEYLIDREGYIRARWAEGMPSMWMRPSYLMEQLDALAKEPAHPALEHHHPS